MTARFLPAMATASAMSVLVAGAIDAASAQDASPWHGDARSAVRLIAGSPRKDGRGATLRAGIEIKLQPGWKTYWRYPGDSGVPPRFDFNGSENLKSITVLWPAPQRFFDGAGGASIGYERDVIFPLRVVAQNPNRPVALRLKLDYAVCEKLCVPVDASAALVLSGGKTSFDATLTAAEARVPKPAVVGEGSALAVRMVRREAGTARPRVLVDVVGRSPLDLFAEGPSPDWALPLPQPVAGAPQGMQRFSFELDGLPPGARPEGAVLKLTAVAGTEAVEVSAHLD
jgi:DsbC/DsbD-like thiol-disulfide interchange protein